MLHRLLLIAVAGAAMPAGVPAATPLLIAPTIVNLPATKRRSTAIEVTNRADEPVDVQLRGYDWTQAGDKDALAPSSVLAISPAIATIPPHAKQTFRILDLGPAASGEKAFRIRVNELPKPGEGRGITVHLEFLVPVFRAAEGTAADLRWSRDGGMLVAENHGTRHVRLADARAIARGGAETVLVGGGPVYLLAGSRRRFAVGQIAADRVTGTTGSGPFDAPLSPVPR